ncbi:APC family permease [Paenibacillus sp. alder61]|uniref:APC family permease n=1 Tax=Paenibacillus faecis TaxID=862114 RepID=A0A5D0CWL8_9BACL|nr:MULTISPECIES: APC family permease [Paenibacillus]MCA1296289.1 APC family permease [Paenibacillus sp. alder61]TYA14233.1 APC family permease [Paenibacillus faecis]
MSELKKNAISWPGAIAMSIAIMAPAAGMMFAPQVVAQRAGGAVPLAFIVSLIGSLFVANTIVQFAKRLPHAGSFFAYNSAGLGKVAGFVSGWLLFSGYFVFYPQNLLAAAFFTSSVCKSLLGIELNWILVALLFAGIIWWLSLRGISNSMKTDMFFVAFEVLVLLLLAVFIIVKGGAEGNTLSVFTPQHSPTSWGGVFFGMIFAMMTFMGFESAATVAEETSNPRKNIPKAIWGSVIGVGIFYIFMTYAMAIGYGPSKGADFAAATIPMEDLASRYVGSGMRWAVDIAGILSAFAVSLALNNATVRVIFAMGRDGVLPKFFGKIDPKLSAPKNSIHTVSLCTIILALTIGILFGPYPNGYGFLGSFGTLPILLLYVIASISLYRFMKRHDPLHFNWWIHAITPGIGGLFMLLPIYGTLFPLPTWPYNLILLLVAIYIAVGVICGFLLRKKGGDMLDRLEKIMNHAGDERPDELEGFKKNDTRINPEA